MVKLCISMAIGQISTILIGVLTGLTIVTTKGEQILSQITRSITNTNVIRVQPIHTGEGGNRWQNQ